MQKGKAIIFSAPSGSGKTTIVKHLLSKLNSLEFSISATSRAPRISENDGQDYYFVSPNDFRDKIGREEFIEWEEVYPDSYYGTLKTEIDRIWKKGHHVIFDVDVVGGVNLKKYFGDNGLAVFIKVPDMATLTTRLNKRGTETAESLAKRISKAEYEMTFEDQFDVTIVNDRLEESLKRSEQLINEFLAK